MTMFKTKEKIEEMFDQIEVSLCDHEPSLRKGLIRGATQMQKDLLDSASKSFNDWLWGVNFGGTTQTEISRMSFAWEMAKLSSMKELQEKDKEIERLKSLIKQESKE